MYSVSFFSYRVLLQYVVKSAVVNSSAFLGKLNASAAQQAAGYKAPGEAERRAGLFSNQVYDQVETMFPRAQIDSDLKKKKKKNAGWFLEDRTDDGS